MNWPFKDMQVGDKVAITENRAAAQRYAHVYGHINGKRFATKTFTTPSGAKVLGVKRLPDTASTDPTVWGAPDTRTSWPFKTLRVGEAATGRIFSETAARYRAYTYAYQTGKAFDLDITETPQGLTMRVTRTV